MPLPDERPRQSVANLIGRFEQQTKRQSLSGTPPIIPGLSRASSAQSQTGGDAAKIEAKEKREWPPKAMSRSPEMPKTEVAALTPPLPVAPEPEAVQEVKVTEDIIDPIPAAPDIETPAPIEPVLEPAPEPTPEPVVPEKTIPVPSSPPRKSANAPSASVPSTPSKSRISSATAARVSASATKPARPIVKSPPSSFHGSLSASTSTPSLKAAAGRTTSTSATPAARPRPSSSASHRPPAAPLRSKTPSGTRSKTPAARPKTPSASTPKAGTPSSKPASGLFAPTAASLARAKNAPETPVASPARKHSLTPAAAERLSKPTASSISKARTPTLPPPAKAPVIKSSPSRGGHVARGTASTRGTAVKAKAGAAKSTGKAPSAVPNESQGEESQAEAEGDHVEPEQHDDLGHDHEQEGSATTTDTLVDDSHTVTQEPEEHTDVSVIVKEEHDDEPAHYDEPEDVHVDESDLANGAADDNSSTDPVVVTHAPDADVPVVSEEETTEEPDESQEPHAVDSQIQDKAADDLDDIVNMLESKPLFSSPAAVPTAHKEPKSVEVAGEIPDEE